MNGNGQQNLRIPVPVIGKQQLGHILILVEEDGALCERDYLASGYVVDASGALHLVMNGGVVASLGTGVWKQARKQEFQPTSERSASFKIEKTS